MATYYVRSTGNDSNNGLAPSLSWATIGKALGATGITSGDTVYIAPGTYRETLTISGNYFNPVNVYGDPTCAYFPGSTPGDVRITNHLSGDNAAATNTAIMSATNKFNLNFKNLYFDNGAANTACFSSTGTTALTFDKCVFVGGGGISLGTNLPNGPDLNVTNCIFELTGQATPFGIFASYATGATITKQMYIYNCLARVNYNPNFATFAMIQGAGPVSSMIGGTIANCTLAGFQYGGAVRIEYNIPGGPSRPFSIRNSIIYGSGTAMYGGAGGAGTVVEDYNRIIFGSRSNVNAGSNSVTAGAIGLDFGFKTLTGVEVNYPMSSSNSANVNIGFGITAGGGTTTDMFGLSWSTGRPDAGSLGYKVLSQIGQYNPTQTNNSSISFPQNSTSKSINLYLGSIGLSSNTSGLQIFYTRQNSTPTNITLAYQTPTGAWTSGGFAEIDSSTAPGYYRLDIPNAALASGVPSVLLGVKGTNNFVSSNLLIDLQNSQIDLTQSIPTSNTPNTVGDALNAARAQGFGKWVITGTSLNLYAPDGTTIIRSFTLNSATEPTSRI